MNSNPEPASDVSALVEAHAAEKRRADGMLRDLRGRGVRIAELERDLASARAEADQLRTDPMALLAALGELIEAMPWDERHERVADFLSRNPLENPQSFFVGVMVVAHAHRLTLGQLDDERRTTQTEHDALQAQVAAAHKINADLGEQSARDGAVLLRQGQQIRALQARIDAAQDVVRDYRNGAMPDMRTFVARLDTALGVDPQKDRQAT